LQQRIVAIHAASRAIGGAPRIHAELRVQGERCSRKRVARLIRLVGVAACHRRRFVTTRRDWQRPSAPDLVQRLTAALEQNRLPRELNKLTHPKLLVIDEVGYLKLDVAQASLVFQVICQRYEKGQALILTSNKAFGEGGEIFGGDAIMAAAALDRLLHRCTVVNIRGESYRLKEKRQAGRHPLRDVEVVSVPAAAQDGAHTSVS
jgi:hypothetical protein